MNLNYKIKFDDLSFELQNSIKQQIREFLLNKYGMSPYFYISNMGVEWENRILKETDELLTNFYGYVEIKDN